MIVWNSELLGTQNVVAKIYTYMHRGKYIIRVNFIILRNLTKSDYYGLKLLLNDTEEFAILILSLYSYIYLENSEENRCYISNCTDFPDFSFMQLLCGYPWITAR